MALADRKYVSLTIAQARFVDWTQFITTKLVVQYQQDSLIFMTMKNWKTNTTWSGEFIYIYIQE